MTTTGQERASSEKPRVDGKAATGRLRRTIVLVGLMGAGKTAVGKRLAALEKVPFVDADAAIVEAAGMSIPDIFEGYGEPAFRDLERRVVTRLLLEPPLVLALGGGAFVDDEIRARVAEHGYSLWLKVDLDTLVARTARKKNSRPLLRAGDPKAILDGLMQKRHPIYARADITFESGDQTVDELVERVREKLRQENILDAV